jgi:hypothetical protein
VIWWRNGQKKAVDALVKKLKEKKDAIEEQEAA